MNDLSKPLRSVLGWQVVVTLAIAAAGSLLSGVHGALSALLGGAVSMVGGLTFALLARPKKSMDQTSAMAWDKLGQILKAEGAKVVVMFGSLWLVLATYKDVVMIGFIGTFILSVIVFSMAVFVRNPALLEAGKNNVN